MLFMVIFYFTCSAITAWLAFDGLKWDKAFSIIMALVTFSFFCLGKASYSAYEYDNDHPCIQTEVQHVYVPLTPQYIYITDSSGNMTPTLVGFTGGNYEDESVCVKRK